MILTWKEESRITSNEGTPVFWRSSRASTSFAVLSLLYKEVEEVRRLARSGRLSFKGGELRDAEAV